MPKTINQEFYGDDMRWFVATVIDSSPPHGLEGRIKIRIHGIHSPKTYDIPQRDLPWAQVMNPSDTYGTSGLGTNCQILPGALVFGIFLDGASSQLPLVFGSLPRVEFPSTVQAEGRDDPSTNPFAFDFKQSNSSMEDPRPNASLSDMADNSVKMNKYEITSFFIDNGMTAKRAASIVGLLDGVSRLDPDHDDGNTGFGIAGWPKGTSRYKRFVAYLRRLSPSRNENDMEGQLMFVMHELHSTHAVAWSKLLRTKEIEGNLYGEKIDGIDERGNGMVAALHKYYLHPSIRPHVNAENAAVLAKHIYYAMGAR